MASTRRKLQARSIALVGFMGAGKSRIGRALAERLDLAFVDTDAEIEAAERTTISEMFEAGGETAFRRAERDAIARLLEGEPKVIALGGGAFVDPDNRDRLNAASRTVWLDPPFDILLSRLARSSRRPLAIGKSDEELRRLWEGRRDSYAAAQLRIATGDGDPRAYADEIVALLA